MIEEVQIYGVPCKFIADAQFELEDGTQIEVPLRIERDNFGSPFLVPDYGQAKEVLWKGGPRT